MRCRTILVTGLLILVASSAAYACSCGAGYYGKNPWEEAKYLAEHGDTIFEGKVVAVQLHMKVLDAKEGEWIPASFDYSPISNNERRDHTSATLEVTRTYRGKTEKIVEVNSFFGGGDCAFEFQVGESYLVVTGPSESGFWVSICGHSSNLRSKRPLVGYLHGEKPTPRDLEPFWGHGRNPKKALPPPQIPTGRICGEIEGLLPEDLENSSIRIRLAFESLPYGAEWSADLDEAGKFCSSPLRPGRYIAYFVGNNEQLGHRSLTFYPGVTHKREARVIEIKGNEDANVRFKAIWQRTQSVRIYIPATHSNDLPGSGRVVILIPEEGMPDLYYSYREELRTATWLTRLHVAHVKFANVLPGRYVVFVDTGGKWLMQKRTIQVADRSQSVFLRLKRQ